MVWPAVIAAGATIAGSLISSKSGGSAGWSKQVYADQKVREDSMYQRRVADAKLAGLHPLFALGTSANYTPTSVSGGRTGSYAGEGIARAGAQIAEGMRESKRQGRQTKLDAASQQIHDLRIQKMGREIALDDAELASRASALKMAEQQQLYWGDSSGSGFNGGSFNSPEAKAYPYGTKVGPELEQRPLIATARTSRPMRSEVIAPDGYRYNIIDPDTGDEISQADLVAQIVLRHTRKARKAPGRELRIQFNRMAAAMKRNFKSRGTSKRRRTRMRNQLRAQSRYGRN